MPDKIAYMEEYRRQASKNPPISSVEPELPLYGGGGGGSSMDPYTALKDYADARDDAVESRLSASLEKLPTKSTIWAAAGTIVGLLLAVAAFAGDRFDGGMTVSPQLEAARKAQADIDAKQDAQAAVLNQKLDIIIKQTSK